MYNDSDRYLVDTLPEEMWDEFFLPSCLLCGGFTSRLQVRTCLSSDLNFISLDLQISKHFYQWFVCHDVEALIVHSDGLAVFQAQYPNSVKKGLLLSVLKAQNRNESWIIVILITIVLSCFLIHSFSNYTCCFATWTVLENLKYTCTLNDIQLYCTCLFAFKYIQVV